MNEYSHGNGIRYTLDTSDPNHHLCQHWSGIIDGHCATRCRGAVCRKCDREEAAFWSQLSQKRYQATRRAFGRIGKS